MKQTVLPQYVIPLYNKFKKAKTIRFTLLDSNTTEQAVRWMVNKKIISIVDSTPSYSEYKRNWI